MARKSRKNNEQREIKERVPQILAERKIKVGGYVRLSSDQYETDSIDTQILMIRQYVNDHPEFEIADFYSDEGYTGTNFVRPEFARLIGDIRSGKVECVIVKDFSRFGRNYVEAGYYLENVFPHLGVRFISINDRYDSSREEDRNGITLPIKNLINSMYAMDVSKKIVKGVELRNQTGTTKYRTTTYGYLLDRENNKLTVDPVASRYVKLIFRWYLMGYSTMQIANRLNAAEVMIPNDYKEQITNRRSSSKYGLWTNAVVGFILKNPTYTGDKVNGRQKTRLLEKIDHEKVEPEEWAIHPNDHEAIIDREQFNAVREKMDNYTKKFRQNRMEVAPLAAAFKNVFSKRVVCGDCGKVMGYHRKNNGSNRYGFQAAYYTCSERKDAPCRNVVYEDYLKTVVLDQIKNLIKYVAGQRETISRLREGRNEKSVLHSNEKKLTHLKKKEADIDNLILNLYKDLADEIIDGEEYKLLNGKYLHEKELVEEEIRRVNEVIFRMRKWIDSFEHLGEKFNELLSDPSDSQTVIDELIESVRVSSKGEIEITFKCQDIIERFKELAGEEDEEDSGVSQTIAV